MTKCAHRVCKTCLEFGVDEDGVYECSICFAPAEFVARSPLGPLRSCSEGASTTRVNGGVGGGVYGNGISRKLGSASAVVSSASGGGGGGGGKYKGGHSARFSCPTLYSG